MLKFMAEINLYIKQSPLNVIHYKTFKNASKTIRWLGLVLFMMRQHMCALYINLVMLLKSLVVDKIIDLDTGGQCDHHLFLIWDTNK